MDSNQLQNYCQQLSQAIADLTEERKVLRNREKQLRVREAAFSMEPAITGGDSLRAALSSILPKHMMPQNVGDIGQVAWPFYYALDFDFGANPTIDVNTRQIQSVQVSQEAAFLLLSVSQNFEAPNSESGMLGPYQVDVRDNQSTRQFNNTPIPLQMIGRNAKPTEFPTPLMFVPNASISVTVSSWLAAGESMTTVGSSAFQISLWGLRVRLDDQASVLSTLYAR